MNESYPQSLWINGRFVALSGIISGNENALTPFEAHTYSFIAEWFSPKNKFEITTSGSTGAPKNIFITRDQMIASARLTAQVLNLRKSETCLVCIDTKFIGGRMMLVRAFTIGLQIFAVDPCANPLEKIPAGQWVNFAAFVPYQIENILESKNTHSFNRVEKAIIGGAPLNKKTIEGLDGFQCKSWATYGMTETISHIALQLLTGEQKQNFFETLPGITIDLDDRGCLVLCVPYLPERIITNDVAVMISKNSFIWNGRFDNIINTGGIKVNPEKIEAAVHQYLLTTGHTLRFFIHGVDDQQLGSRVVLVIEAITIAEDFLRSLASFLAASLSNYEIPKDALLVANFSETPNGKINRLQTVKGVHANVSLK
jgi:O-succinylbenzoic acid--CoA ligase